MKNIVLKSIAFFMLSVPIIARADVQTTDPLTVTFKVKVKKKQCVVDVKAGASVHNPIDLGKIKKKIGATTNIIPLEFKFHSCDGAKVVESITYSRDLFGQGHQDKSPFITTQFTDDNSMSPVRIYLYENQDGTVPFKTKNFGAIGHQINETEWVSVSFIQAKIPEGSNLSKKGNFKGAAQFSITYN